MIIRVFRAIVKPGQHKAFENFLRKTAVPLVQSQEAVLTTYVGIPTEYTPDEFVFISTWRDIAGLKHFSGEQWQEEVLAPEAAVLLSASYIYHYESLPA